jgi:hypothetical protein
VHWQTAVKHISVKDVDSFLDVGLTGGSITEKKVKLTVSFWEEEV